MVEHSSANPWVDSGPGLIPGLLMHEACIMHHTPGVVHDFPKAVGV